MDLRVAEGVTPPVPQPDARRLERRGRWWMALSFLACPCHLPLTLGVAALVLGGSAAGVAVRENALVAGLVLAAVWLAGTARGLWLVRRAQRDGYACATAATARSSTLRPWARAARSQSGSSGV